ncbi:uncharacterized protein LOC125740870 isoform X4 [Brienomyrus brachyistius]|uniref:uncharacterized protein LOC125740870 isoform X4 n=1 Tax=Brienomyrus brachyistius TaxID=42636 RepID=UPI0020B427FB|nr:uncharacterized protein LOC125740870 isoform X4 [Brienomyrus brachyistius]
MVPLPPNTPRDPSLWGRASYSSVCPPTRMNRTVTQKLRAVGIPLQAAFIPRLSAGRLYPPALCRPPLSPGSLQAAFIPRLSAGRLYPPALCRPPLSPGSLQAAFIPRPPALCCSSELQAHSDSAASVPAEPAGDRKQRDAVMPPGGRPFCRPYREREDPPGASSGGNVIVGIVVAVMAVVAVVGAAVFFKRQWNRQGDENLPDPGPSEHPLINAASGPVGDSSAERMEEPEKTG